MNDVIAVILATYNGEKFVRKQLDSLLSQTYQHYVIYIRDDSSTDGTVQIIKEYVDMYPKKIFFLKNRNNLGFLKTYELLLRDCSEEYIAFCDQDDIWNNDKIEKEYYALKEVESANPGLPVLVHSDLEMIDEEDRTICNSFFDYKMYIFSKKKDLGSILGPCGVMGNTILINKWLKMKILPFFDPLDYHDYYIAVVNEICGKRVTLKDRLVRYRIHSSNTSNNRIGFKKESKCRLPYRDSKRKYLIKYLLSKVDSDKDKHILLFFYSYLTKECPNICDFLSLLRFNLVKASLLYRFLLFFRFGKFLC